MDNTLHQLCVAQCVYIELHHISHVATEEREKNTTVPFWKVREVVAEVRSILKCFSSIGERPRFF